MIATSVLPIDSSTICYGSPNGGVTVYDNIKGNDLNFNSSNLEFYAQMEVAGNILKIKPHVVGLHPSGTYGKVLPSSGELR